MPDTYGKAFLIAMGIGKIDICIMWIINCIIKVLLLIEEDKYGT